MLALSLLSPVVGQKSPQDVYYFYMNDSILVVTTNDVAGYEIVQVYGEVFGVLVRSRNLLSNIGAGLKSIIGGEIGGYTKLVSDSRVQAMERMKQAAAAKGAIAKTR